MTEDEFDEMVDDATHAVNNIIPDEMLAKLSVDQHTALLTRINDALTPILFDIVEEIEED